MSPTDLKREFAIEVVQRLKQAGYRALWAGGCVRDFLLGRDPKDYDVATDARPDDVRNIFGKRRTLAVGAVFGVIIVRGPKAAGDVEVATFRTEGPYLDGRRPEHVTFSSPEEDASRRDFTINGMFYDPLEQQPLDFVGGEKDLGAGIVRAIGDPHDRMREDKLRMLRAIRFAATLNFELDSLTAAAVKEMAAEIHVVSAERITQEFRKMLTDAHRRRAVQLAHEVRLLDEIIPELSPVLAESVGDLENSTWKQTLEMLQLLQEPSFELAAATLLHAIGRKGLAEMEEHSMKEAALRQPVVRGLCKRLRFSNHETDHTCWLLTHQYDLLDAPSLSLATLKRVMGQPLIHDLLAMNRVETLASAGNLKSVVFCEEFLRNTSAEEINPPALLSGDDLIDRGLSPGPRFKDILHKVRDAQLNAEISTRQEAFDLADRLQHD